MLQIVCWKGLGADISRKCRPSTIYGISIFVWFLALCRVVGFFVPLTPQPASSLGQCVGKGPLLVEPPPNAVEKDTQTDLNAHKWKS